MVCKKHSKTKYIEVHFCQEKFFEKLGRQVLKFGTMANEGLKL